MPTALELLSDPALGLVREVRQPQLQMARSIEEVLTDGGVYLAEAPTATGKGYGYLTPAIARAGRRIVVATAKKQLQDQLKDKDIPAIAKAFGITEGALHTLTLGAEGEQFFLSRILKGKSNYACQLQARKHPIDATYNNWIAHSPFGDRADYPGAPPAWWPVATAEDCVGRACDHHNTCGFIKLKQEIKQTRVVVVNHHLLGSDMFYGLGKLVGGPYDILIVDEAHKFAEGIRSAFTLEAAENSIVGLEKALSNTTFALGQVQPLLATWQEMFNHLPNKHWQEMHLREAPVFPVGSEEAISSLQRLDGEIKGILTAYNIKGDPDDRDFWDEFAAALEDQPDPQTRSDLMTGAITRRKISALKKGINIMQGQPLEPDLDAAPGEITERSIRIMANTVIYGHADRRGVFRLGAAPVSVGGIAHNYLSSVKSVVLTSATLAVDGGFDNVADTLGVPVTKAEILPSTFNYAKQSFCFIPRDLPHAARNDAQYPALLQRRIDYCVELVKLSEGGAFILTTANDDLDAIATALMSRVSNPVFVQGHSKNPWHGDPPSVLQQYMAAKDAVLVGSKSFWEGVDVQGEKLRMVIVSKLPFPSPKDPLIIARTSRYPDSLEGWRHVSYVDMMIDLRQGIGRLIRSTTDRGMVAILDSRLWDKQYGGQVRRALQFPITGKMDDCRASLPRIVAYLRRLGV